MPDTSTLVLFFGAALALLVTPGPAVIFVITRSIERGRAAGVVSASGMAVGTLFHVTAAVAGLSALMLSSAMAFNSVKYAGALYLIYLGIRKLFSREDAFKPDRRKSGDMRQLFLQAVMVNALNPKTALFFIAFLPQFIDTSKGTVAGQVLFFGVALAIMGFFSDSLYALLAGGTAKFFRGAMSVIPRYVSGGVYIGLGIVAAFSSLERK